MIRLRDSAFLEDFCHIIVLRDWSLFMPTSVFKDILIGYPKGRNVERALGWSLGGVPVRNVSGDENGSHCSLDISTFRVSYKAKTFHIYVFFATF